LPLDGSAQQLDGLENHYPLLYEMLRSFSTLSRTLNLSQAVRELGSTRQTVRRHIAQLEDAFGHPLFAVRDRSYELTEEGARIIPAAEDILARGRLLINGGLREIDGMPQFSVRTEQGWEFHQQQMPLSHVWNGPSKLLKAALKAWTLSEGKLDAEPMDAIRPYILVYRESVHDWLCVEIGEQSFYSKWWGWRNARSSIGRPLNKFPGGPQMATLMDEPYKEILQTRSARLDQVVTKVPRDPEGHPIPNAFNRLLLGSQFPDGSFALIIVVDRPERIEVDGLEQEFIKGMPEDAVVNFKEN